MSEILVKEISLLFIKNRPALMKYALRMTKNKEVAEDLVHDSLLNMYKNATSFKQGTNFINWANKIIKHLFIDSLRKRKNIQEVEIQDYHKGSCSNNGIVNLENAELYKVIDKFSKENKKIVMLYLQGFTREEIAKQMKWGKNKLNSRLHKLRNILKKELGNEKNLI